MGEETLAVCSPSYRNGKFPARPRDLLRSVLAHDDIAADRLLVLSGPCLPAGYAFYLVTDLRNTLPAKSQVFVDWVRAQIKAMEPSG